MEPLVSVIMPVWKPTPTAFQEAVHSVLQQTFEHYEFVIVEDPSDVEAGDLLASMRDDRIRHIRNPERTGLLAQRNRTLAEARAEIVALLDADDAMEPHRLQSQFDYMNRHPDVTVLGSAIRIIDSSGRVTGRRDYPLSHEEIVRAFPRYDAIAQPAVMARKRPLQEIGGYRFEFPVEDYDLWSRLAKSGHRFANLPDCLTRYRVGGATKAEKLRRTLQLTREVKSNYWIREMTFRDRLRYWGEGMLMHLPSGFVNWLFRVLTYRRER